MSASFADARANDSLDERGMVTVPAQLRFLELIRTAVRVGLGASGVDAGCVSDVQLAADELAALLILSARSSGQLRLCVTHEDGDVLVRMSVPLSESGFHPQHPELSRLLLDATADSHDIRVRDGLLVGVFRRANDRAAR